MSTILSRGDSCVFFGAESDFAVDMYESATRLGVMVTDLITLDEPLWDMFGRPAHSVDTLPSSLLTLRFIVTRNNPAIRKKYDLRSVQLGFQNLLSLIDPTAVVPPSTTLGAGCYVNAGAVLGGQCTLGRAVFVNRRASLGHQTTLDDYVSIGPGVSLASRVRVGAGTMIGVGAIVGPGIAIGSNSVVTMGAVVHKDVAANTVVAGNPARLVKSGIEGYRGLGV